MIKVKTKAELKALCDDLNANLYDIDTSKITDMSELFKDSFRSDFSFLSSWELKQVKNASYMFCGCLNILKLPKLVFRDIQNAQSMFENCINLKTLNMQIVFSSKYERNFLNNLKNTKRMFRNCTNLSYINKLNLRSVENADEMFMGCLSLKYPRVKFLNEFLRSLDDIHTNSSVVFDEALLRLRKDITNNPQHMRTFYDRGVLDILCDDKEFLRHNHHLRLSNVIKDELYDKAKEIIRKGGLINAKYLSLKLGIDTARANTILHELEIRGFLDIKAKKVLKKIKNLSPSDDGILHIVSANKYDFICKGDSKVLEEIFYNDECCDEFYEKLCSYKGLKIDIYDSFCKLDAKSVKFIYIKGGYQSKDYKDFLYQDDWFLSLSFKVFSGFKNEEFKLIVFKII